MTLKDITILDKDDLYDLRVHNYIKIKSYEYEKLKLIKEEAENKNIKLYIRYWEKVKILNERYAIYKCYDRYKEQVIYNTNYNLGESYFIIYDYNIAIDKIKLDDKIKAKRKRLELVSNFKSINNKRVNNRKNLFIKTFLRLS